MTHQQFHTPQTLLQHLDTLGIKATTLWHEAVFSVDESRDLMSQIVGAHSKNLFLKDDKGQLWLISAEQSTKINLKALPKIIGSGRLSFGSEDRLFTALGVRPGSVTALALINDIQKNVRFILDKRLDEAQTVNFHPLTNTGTTSLNHDDFKTFLKSVATTPIIVNFDDEGLQPPL